MSEEVLANVYCCVDVKVLPTKRNLIGVQLLATKHNFVDVEVLPTNCNFIGVQFGQATHFHRHNAFLLTKSVLLAYKFFRRKYIILLA